HRHAPPTCPPSQRALPTPNPLPREGAFNHDCSGRLKAAAATGSHRAGAPMMGSMWEPELRRRAELTADELAEQSDLGRRAWAASAEPDARYPRGIPWSEPTWLALVRAPDGRLIGRAGVLERTVRWNGLLVAVGGVSSVSTDPAFRGQGVASAAVSRVTTFA